jgi:putative CocE/NonD family hydrolase
MRRYIPVAISLSLASASFVAFSSSAQTTSAVAPDIIPDMPSHFKVEADSFDYIRRDAEIPMRDGKHLHTVIIIPKNSHNAPILLTRTPYNADAMVTRRSSGHMSSALHGYDNMTDVIEDGGYIRVIQDVRGKYGSEGDYVMNRPLRGPFNHTDTDHSTDTWDTIEWLVHNIPESNGKVGIIGVSYDGFTALEALFNPHPALKVSVPMNPLADGWNGDDWFHNGAFRQQMLPYIYNQDATRSNTKKWWSNTYDDYDLYMNGVSAGAIGQQHGMDQIGFFRQLIAHPAFDSFWKDMAVNIQLEKINLTVPTMIVHSFWDQEDIYGAIASYRALEKHQGNKDNIFLVMGPWHHGGESNDADTLGAIRFGSDTGLYFRKRILEPFLAHYLKDDTTQPLPSHITTWRSGENIWETASDIPPEKCSSCNKLYVSSNNGLSLSKKSSGTAEYISDPAHPVPYLPRPNQQVGHESGDAWPNWLASDQRSFSGRTDVLTFTSSVLDKPFKISGQPGVHLTTSTTGTDGDFVVKLIDVWPDEVPAQPEMGGYQFMVSGDIFRGRYRNSLEHPEPIPSGKMQLYAFNLPITNHTFLPGHKIMVQIQSAWFPLYDRNPQTYVENIFLAPATAYKPAKITVDLANTWIDLSEPTASTPLQ